MEGKKDRKVREEEEEGRTGRRFLLHPIYIPGTYYTDVLIRTQLANIKYEFRGFFRSHDLRLTDR